MKTKLFFLISIISISLTVSGQYNMLPASDLITDYSGQIRSSVNKTTLSIEGNPYIYDDFKAGVIFPKNDDRVFKVKLNVNAFSNLFEMQFEDRIYEMPNYAFDSIKIDGRTFIPVSIFKDDVVTFYTMEVLSTDEEGNYLVRQYIIHLLEATSAKAYHQATAARYQTYPSNYFIYESEARSLIPLRQVKALTKNPDFPIELKDFIKSNRIKNRNIADLQKLFNYLYLEG